MALLLNESGVRAVLTMRIALDAVETAFRHPFPADAGIRRGMQER